MQPIRKIDLKSFKDNICSKNIIKTQFDPFTNFLSKCNSFKNTYKITFTNFLNKCNSFENTYKITFETHKILFRNPN